MTPIPHLGIIVTRSGNIEVNQRKVFMRINVFEGSRRIAVLITAIAIISSFAYAIFTEPYVRVFAQFDVMKKTTTLVDSCAQNDSREYADRVNSKGKTITAIVCFPAVSWNDGQIGYPYRNQSGELFAKDSEFDLDVKSYYKAVATRIELSRDMEDKFSKNRTQALIEQWQEMAIGLVGGLAVFWMIVVTTGWIVRGFLGIPRGLDEKPKDSI